MQLKLGDTIRTLRKNAGRTQESLALALGVTSQAVSRWEQNGAYPDMEMIPAIANYFGITIDELFGYQNDRGIKIDNIISKINAFGIKGRSDDLWINDALTILREGLAEFPANEKLLITLSETLFEAGYRHYGEESYYDEAGYLKRKYEFHKKNEYWTEAITICESLLSNSTEQSINIRAIKVLVILNQNIGNIEKAIKYAKLMPSIENSSEILLANATDGKNQFYYNAKALLTLANTFAKQLIISLMNNVHNYETDMPITKVKGAINLFELIMEDGNFGEYNSTLIQLYLYLSRLEYERGYHNEAFLSLDKALECAKNLEAILDGKEHYLTSSLVKSVASTPHEFVDIVKNLPSDWPWWHAPDYSKVAEEIKADPRWKEWITKTK